MMGSGTRSGFRVGAAITVADNDKLYSEQLTPLLESFSALAADVDNASAFVQKSNVRAVLDSVYASINTLDDRLSTLDASDVTNWKADVVNTQARINQLTNEFAVYTQSANKSALYSSAVAAVLGGLAAVVVYRRKRSRKWAVFAGSGAAAASGFTSWFISRPKFE
jgi:hypothetical protein